MSKRMLIDGAHPEETRVVVMSGTQLDEYDIETSYKKQIKGNIYLAKVIRVEPSLQAAFVDFGGDRHGFLAFSDIHPDYYQIPIDDRQMLKAEQMELGARAAREHLEDLDGDTDDTDLAKDSDTPADEEAAPDASEPAPRRYKIQEVIKRRQILLVQVVKEERGNKGAALTTYISLAGRCCVLLPNTSRGGGISRKITNVKERRKLRDILGSLDIPEGIGVIIRTAGRERNKAELRRDFEYLLRVWDQIRQKTLGSSAPCLVHEEGNIIKRTIRDVYSRDIEEILVEGGEAYRCAKEFMRLMMPSHAKRVQPFRDETVSLLQRYGIEQQLDAMHSPAVPLPSGGSLVINPTEALVAIDVNSGQATRERNIERTALKTNLEAADEVARQLRLRDLSGLIVIDFIDMEDNRNVRKVERRFRDAMRVDRARQQIGQISDFGLMELSRQRLRPSLIETSSYACPHCRGTGNVLSTEAMALRVLRAVEEETAHVSPGSEIRIKVPPEIALYVLNYKRQTLDEIEERHSLKAVLVGDSSIIPPDIGIELPENQQSPAKGRTQKSEAAKGKNAGEEARPSSRKRRPRKAESAPQEEQAAAAGQEPDSTKETTDRGSEAEAKPSRRRRRRRKNTGEAAAVPETGADQIPEQATAEETPQPAKEKPKRRRASRRRKEPEEAQKADSPAIQEAGEQIPEGSDSNGQHETPEEAKSADSPPPRRNQKTRADSPGKSEDQGQGNSETDAPPPARRRRRRATAKSEPGNETPKAEGARQGPDQPATEVPENKGSENGAEADATPDSEAVPMAAAPPESRPKRRGWWRRSAAE